MYYASICAIIKDEDKDIREWLNYHFAIGFEHVLIFDNNSKNPLQKQIPDYISSGLATVVDFPLTEAQQLSAYMNALKQWGHNTRWLAFIDVDEFITPLEHTDIRDFLDNYTQFGGVGANWAMFGSGGWISRPRGGILENYTSSLGLNPHIKSIVQPARTRVAKSAHHFTYRDGYCCVNEDGIPILGFNTYPLADKIRINHYYYKSQQDFCDKIGRGLATQMKNGKERNIQNFYEHLELPATEDNVVLRFLPAVVNIGSMSPIEIISYLYRDMPADPESEISAIESLINKGNLHEAYNRFKVLARYHDGFDPETFKPLSAGQQEPKIISVIRQKMLREQSTPEALIQCYNLLANWYLENGQTRHAQNIKDWLGVV